MRTGSGDTTTLTLHGGRLLVFAQTHQVAARFALDRDEVGENLLDLEAHGWVTRSEFAGLEGWSLTDRGRPENERRLAAELDGAAAPSTLREVHRRFLPLNSRFPAAATAWQPSPCRGIRWPRTTTPTLTKLDDRVIESLTEIGRRLVPLETDLVNALARFGGYAERYSAAVARVARGESRWVDGLGIDSCHVVWMQLHEDLLATG